MTQAFNQCSSPRHASRKRAAIDRLLEPALFKAIADPNRARVLACLIKCARPCSVTEVAACCSVDFSMVARQLAALARAGLLESRKEGRTMWYTARHEQLIKTFQDLADAVGEWAQPTTSEGGCCDE